MQTLRAHADTTGSVERSWYVVSLMTVAHKAGRLRGFTMFISFRLPLLL
jgi:hypothetical protein